MRRWLADLETRHLGGLTFPEIRRALQALSSLYVERREQLPAGAALQGAGKRAAFALYYGPLHFLIVREIVRALGASRPAPPWIFDLGCGTAASGAAWSLEAGGRPFVFGVDRHGWAVEEARRTLASLGLEGRIRRGDAAAARLPEGRGAVLAAFSVNELSADRRERLRDRVLVAARRGVSVLVVEPVSTRVSPWWGEWAAGFAGAGGRQDAWRFPADLPEVLAALDRAAGLDHRELTARSLWLPSRRPGLRPGDRR